MKGSEMIAERENFLQITEDAGRHSSHSGLPFQFLSNLPEYKLKHCSSLRVYDAFVTLAGVSLCYVAFWRGSFGVLFYSLNVNQMYLLSFIGAMMNVYFAITRNTYDEHLIQKTWPYAVLRVIYTYTVEMGLIFQWAGLWFLMEYYINLRVSVLSSSSVASVIALLILRSCVNLLTTPFRVFCTNRKFTRRLKSSDQILDYVLAAVVVAPAVVSYWRGTWILSELYLFPENGDISMLSSLIIGFLGQLVFTYVQDYLADNFHPSVNRFVFYLTSRVYTYIYGVVCVNLWRGIWQALDMFSGQETLKVLIPTITSIIFLAASRILRNLSASPFLVAVDLPEGYFAVPTMFKITRSKVDSLFVLDTLFSVFVVGSLVVFAWRGVWCLFDIYLYPDDEVLSALTSLVVGYAIVLIVFGLQSPMKKCCEALTGFWRLVVLDLYIFFSFMGTINVWRGIWNLLNIYLLPDAVPLSCWITHFVGFGLLIFINCSNSILVRGVAVDGEEEGGKCVIFPISYLRTIFSGAEKKESSEQEEVSKNKNDVTV